MIRRLIGIILLCTGAAKSIALVQQATCLVTNGTTCVCTLAVSPTAGNALIVNAGNRSTWAITGITGGGVTWGSVVISATNAETEQWVGYGSSGSGTTITTTFNTKGGHQGNCSEWSGLGGTTDGASANSGTSTTPTTATLNTTNADNVLVASYNLSSNDTFSSGPTNSFIALTTPANIRFGAAYRIVSATGSYSTSWTNTGSQSWDAVIAAYKAVVGGTSIKDPIMRGVIVRPR